MDCSAINRVEWKRDNNIYENHTRYMYMFCLLLYAL